MNYLCWAEATLVGVGGVPCGAQLTHRKDSAATWDSTTHGMEPWEIPVPEETE